MNVVKQRPEGPTENSPGREAGERDENVEHRRCGTCSAVVPRLRRSISPQSYPGLTAGLHCRPSSLGTSIRASLLAADLRCHVSIVSKSF